MITHAFQHSAKIFLLAIIIIVVVLAFRPSTTDDLKIFISVDMEGVAGVVAGKEGGWNFL